MDGRYQKQSTQYSSRLLVNEREGEVGVGYIWQDKWSFVWSVCGIKGK